MIIFNNRFNANQKKITMQNIKDLLTCPLRPFRYSIYIICSSILEEDSWYLQLRMIKHSLATIIRLTFSLISIIACIKIVSKNRNKQQNSFVVARKLRSLRMVCVSGADCRKASILITKSELNFANRYYYYLLCF